MECPSLVKETDKYFNSYTVRLYKGMCRVLCKEVEQPTKRSWRKAGRWGQSSLGRLPEEKGAWAEFRMNKS